MPYGDYSTKRRYTQTFFEKHFDFLTSVPQRRIQEIILSSCMKGNSGKMTDYAESGAVHRTTYGHFLSKGKWDDKKLEETQKRESFQTVSELSHKNGMPLFVSIDDTVLTKTPPSSKAKHPTEGTGWHYSHLEGKVVLRIPGPCSHCWDRRCFPVLLPETIYSGKWNKSPYDFGHHPHSPG